MEKQQGAKCCGKAGSFTFKPYRACSNAGFRTRRATTTKYIIPLSLRPNALLAHILYKSSCPYNTTTKEPSCKSHIGTKKKRVKLNTLSAHTQKTWVCSKVNLMRRWHVRCCCKTLQRAIKLYSQFRIIARDKHGKYWQKALSIDVICASAKQVWLCDIL